MIAVDIVPGPAGDAPQLVPMLDRTPERVEVEEIVGDKGFDGDPLRCDCLNREVNPNIPLKADRDPEARAFDPVSYKERNRVERLFAKAKQFRRIATRYEKLKGTYLGLLHLVLGFIRLRKQRNVNTPPLGRSRFAVISSQHYNRRLRTRVVPAGQRPVPRFSRQTRADFPDT